MNISFITLEKICNCKNITTINSYLRAKHGGFTIKNEQLEELKQMYSFLEHSIIKQNLKKITHINIFCELFKYEHDALLFFRKKNKRIIIDIEMKKNSEPKKAEKQMIAHIQFLGSRLPSTNNQVYGVSVISQTNTISIHQYNSKNKKTIKKKLKIIDLLETFIKRNYNFVANSDAEIKEMESSINETISICLDNSIKLTTAENDLVKWIQDNIENNDFLIVDANGGVGKTTILLKLFFNEYCGESHLLLNNVRLRKTILSKYGKSEWFESLFFLTDSLKNCSSSKRILLVDEAQRLSEDQIYEQKKLYEKIIMFGDKHQCFESEYSCNYADEEKFLEASIYEVKFKKFYSDTRRRSSKDFPNLIKAMFNQKKYKLQKGRVKISEKICLYDEFDEFHESYEKQKLHAKLFTEIQQLRRICESENIKEKGWKELIGKENYDFMYNGDYESIGTAFSAYSFELNAVYLIIQSSLKEIEKNAYLFNEIYTICSRTKNELHILLYNGNIGDYCKLNKILKRKNISYEN